MSQDLDLEASPKSTGSLSSPKSNGTSNIGSDIVGILEAKANGM
jgi:hypothetical protein